MIKSDISEIVNKCYKYYGLSYPVDLYELSKRLSIKVLNTDLDSEGYFINKHGKLYILLRKNSIDDKRKRFTFAHEIGHALLHADSSIIRVDANKDKYFNYTKELDTIEKQANYFASELLCPSKNLKKELPNRTLTFEFIDRIADKYQISRQTAAIKCVEHSKTENELLIFYDENNEIRWYVSQDSELKYMDLPNDLANVESFMEEYYDHLELYDSYLVHGYGTTVLLSGIVNQDFYLNMSSWMIEMCS